MLIFNCSPVSEVISSIPNSEFSLTNLKFSCAVFPKSFFILSGSLIPGNSTNILFSPRCKIVGSFVPTSSILRLIISIDCFNAELFIVKIPNFENEILILLLSNSSYSNSKDLYLSI